LAAVIGACLPSMSISIVPSEVTIATRTVSASGIGAGSGGAL
jgi:hypothetical protein